MVSSVLLGGCYLMGAPIYAFRAPTALAQVGLSGLVLKGATLHLENCTGCSLSDLALYYPTYDREVKELNNPPGTVAATVVRGRHLTVENFTLTQSNNNGLKLGGYNVSLDNCLISYTDWMGSLTYTPLGVTGNQVRWPIPSLFQTGTPQPRCLMRLTSTSTTQVGGCLFVSPFFFSRPAYRVADRSHTLHGP